MQSLWKCLFQGPDIMPTVFKARLQELATDICFYIRLYNYIHWNTMENSSVEAREKIGLMHLSVYQRDSQGTGDKNAETGIHIGHSQQLLSSCSLASVRLHPCLKGQYKQTSL